MSFGEPLLARGRTQPSWNLAGNTFSQVTIPVSAGH
jgi:hypothetical protein